MLGDFSKGLAIVMLTVYLIKTGKDPYTFQFVPESVSVMVVKDDQESCDEDEVVPYVEELEGSTDGAVVEDDMKSEPNEVDDASEVGEYSGLLEEVVDVSDLNPLTCQFDTKSCDDKEEERRKDFVDTDVDDEHVPTLENAQNTDVTSLLISDVISVVFSCFFLFHHLLFLCP